MTKQTLSCLLAALACGVTAQAQFTEFTATLTPEQDGGGARTGTGLFTLSLSGSTVTISGEYSGLSGNANAGHIHGPSGLFPETAGVLYNFATLGLATFSGPSGTVRGTFELVPRGTGGSYTVEQQIADLNNGRWYINIHSLPNFGGGEIRGQLTPVPEPGAMALGALGMGLGLMLWRRRSH